MKIGNINKIQHIPSFKIDKTRVCATPTHLGSINCRKDCKVIASYNFKGGVGKTTTIVNLATALVTQQGKRVCIIDADPQCNTTSILAPLQPPEDMNDSDDESGVATRGKRKRESDSQAEPGSNSPLPKPSQEENPYLGPPFGSDWHVSGLAAHVVQLIY